MRADDVASNIWQALGGGSGRFRSGRGAGGGGEPERVHPDEPHPAADQPHAVPARGRAG